MQEYGTRAMRYAYGMLHDRGAAEDVAQEAFLRLWRHAERHGMATVSPALLFHAVTNLCRDHHRSQFRHPEVPLEDLSTVGGSVDPDVLEHVAVWGAVMKLNPQEREAILLFYLLDRSVKDIATALKVSEQVVKTRLHRARGHLRPILEANRREELG